MKETALSRALVSGLIFLLFVGAQSVSLVGANPIVGGYWENSNTVAVPLKVTILSPQNDTTYSSKDINLTIKITKTVTADPMEVEQFYVSYNLDMSPDSPPSLIGDDVVDNDCSLDVYYSTVLHSLSDRKHSLLVSVECFPENVSAYGWRTKTYAEASFSVDTGSGTPAPTLTPTPTPSPEPVPVGEYPEGPQILWNRTISEWNETAGQYTHCSAGKIIQASDGGYVVVGESFGSSSEDWDSYEWWLVKTDSNANVEWEKTFGGPYRDFVQSVIQTNDGGYAIAGTMNDKATVVKTDSAGNAQWNRTYSHGTNVSNYAYIIQTSDRGYALAFDDWDRPDYFTYFGPAPNVQLVKTDAFGNEEWSKTYVEGNAFWVIQTSDGGYALLSSSSSGITLIKTDALGELEWKKTYGSVDDYGLSAVQAKDGGFVLFGMLTVYRRCPGLIKTDAEGKILWAKNYLRERAIPGDVVATSDGGYIFCATEEWTIEEGDVFGEVVKVDSEGNISWVISLVDGAAGSVVQTFDEGYALVETGTLMDYEAWEEYYSAVWIIKIEKATSNPTPAIAPTPITSIEPFPSTLLIGSAVAVVAVAGLALLVHFEKRQRDKNP